MTAWFFISGLLGPSRVEARSYHGYAGHPFTWKAGPGCSNAGIPDQRRRARSIARPASPGTADVCLWAPSVHGLQHRPGRAQTGDLLEVPGRRAVCRAAPGHQGWRALREGAAPCPGVAAKGRSGRTEPGREAPCFSAAAGSTGSVRPK
ncbi:hypothetical protein SB18R_03165 [Pseudomonas oryzihabitans]|nr:hypothetical protein SB9_12400 [Pseudomonas psychrotolerans]KTT78248.1 hypothetical protein SB18R_03165 [Pseudomonas psychrotolerans]